MSGKDVVKIGFQSYFRGRNPQKGEVEKSRRMVLERIIRFSASGARTSPYFVSIICITSPRLTSSPSHLLFSTINARY